MQDSLTTRGKRKGLADSASTDQPRKKGKKSRMQGQTQATGRKAVAAGLSMRRRWMVHSPSLFRYEGVTP